MLSKALSVSFKRWSLSPPSFVKIGEPKVGCCTGLLDNSSAAKKLSSHLWYFSEEQVALGFLEPDVTCEDKWLMSEAIQTRHGAPERTPRLQPS